MKHIKSLTAILVMLTLVLASCGGQNPVVKDATSSTNEGVDENTDSGLETEALSKDPTFPAPTVTITSTAYQNIDLRVETDLAKQFKVTHRFAKKVTLTVTSDKDGVLFNGDWLIDPTLFTPSTLKRTFATPGTRTITVTAVAGIRSRTGTFYLNVINTAPVIKLHYDGSPYVGESFWVTAQILDKNEPDGTKICANTTWTIDAPNTLDTSTGCRVRLAFSNVFTYQLRVSTHDSEGAEAVNAVNMSVLPMVPGRGLDYLDNGAKHDGKGYFIAQTNANGPESRCRLRQYGVVPQGTTIYFDVAACSYMAVLNPKQTEFPGAFKSTFSVFVTDAQGNETLLLNTPATRDVASGVRANIGGPTSSYDSWRTDWDLPRLGTLSPVTHDCRIVSANKNLLSGVIRTFTVWVGKCTYNTGTLN